MNGRATAPKPLRLFRDPTTDQALASRYQPQKQASQNRTPESLCQPQQKHLETEHLNHCANQSSRHLKQNTCVTVPTTARGIFNRTSAGMPTTRQPRAPSVPAGGDSVAREVFGILVDLQRTTAFVQSSRVSIRVVDKKR